jgi:1,4-alpha-glucan branching enzyme
MARKQTRTTETKTQTFAITAPGATSVMLVGDFTHWQEKPIAMNKQTSGIWTVTIKLSPGRHHYRFLVDGQWRDDPECTLRVPNPFGGENSVRAVS